MVYTSIWIQKINQYRTIAWLRFDWFNGADWFIEVHINHIEAWIHYLKLWDSCKDFELICINLQWKYIFQCQIGRNLSIIQTNPSFSVVTSRWQQSLCDDDSIQSFKTSNTSYAWRDLYKKAIMLIVLIPLEAGGSETVI